MHPLSANNSFNANKTHKVYALRFDRAHRKDIYTYLCIYIYTIVSICQAMAPSRPPAHSAWFPPIQPKHNASDYSVVDGFRHRLILANKTIFTCVMRLPFHYEKVLRETRLNRSSFLNRIMIK